MTEKPERLSKIMAHAGVCSRREAETWIAAGRVSLNGAVVTEQGTVATTADQLTIDGKPLVRKTETRLWLYHKPRGLITTHYDPEGRETVFDNLPKSMPRVISVGRLDVNSEGLLLLTNDGELSRALELPKNQMERCYRVRVFGTLDPWKIRELTSGMTIEGTHYQPVQVEVESTQGLNSWLLLTLKEGKNREIRRLMDAVELNVSRLIRVAYGPFELGGLAHEHVQEVPFTKVQTLLKQLGLRT